MATVTGPRWNTTSTDSPRGTVAVGVPFNVSWASDFNALLNRTVVSSGTEIWEREGCEPHRRTPDPPPLNTGGGVGWAVGGGSTKGGRIGAQGKTSGATGLNIYLSGGARNGATGSN